MRFKVVSGALSTMISHSEKEKIVRIRIKKKYELTRKIF